MATAEQDIPITEGGLDPDEDNGNGDEDQHPVFEVTTPSLEAIINATQQVNDYFTVNAQVVIRLNEAQRNTIYFGHSLKRILTNLNPNLPENRYNPELHREQTRQYVEVFLQWITEILPILSNQQQRKDSEKLGKLINLLNTF